MSENLKPNGDGSHAAGSPPNGQLATPALSPISEHGDRQLQPFPPWDGDENLVTNKSASRRGIDASSGKKVEPIITANEGPSAQDRRKSSASSSKAAKLSPIQLQDLVFSPENLPVRVLDPHNGRVPALSIGGSGTASGSDLDGSVFSESGEITDVESNGMLLAPALNVSSVEATTPDAVAIDRPAKTTRSTSMPLVHRKGSSFKLATTRPPLAPLKTEDDRTDDLKGDGKVDPADGSLPSPIPSVIPLPPLSLPTYLQLELSSDRPSALYIHQSAASHFPYESSKVKFERLKSFLMLPPNLEQVLLFGAVACLDAWLYPFTILPLRFLKAIAILVQWWTQNALKEIHDLSTFVYRGLGRVWQRRRQGSVPSSRRPSLTEDATVAAKISGASTTSEGRRRPNSFTTSASSAKQNRRRLSGLQHRRTKSTPSELLPNHKADILQGLLIAISCSMLMWLDASRMYHNIRGQAAIKLYVIYNVLEVFDRLFSAIGQDVLECLFSKETLERDEYGRSKILRPLWMFLLALVYNVVHSTALFYQVVTLNVAVNSYSNALLTLLMSNQFVEIKGTVFKKFDKENLFQLTCADIVERFQLWLMLLIIALRNIVEVGGLSISLNNVFSGISSSPQASNSTALPFNTATLVPKAFTLFPKWTGEVLGPFLIVLGSEALVDWCKHAYITKFNQVKPNIYGRFLDVLAKDYYSHAFADQNLTKRLGLPVIPLSCLFIRACVQTYHMFLATYMPLPVASAATSIAVDNETVPNNPATTAALQHVDQIFRRALGRSSFGAAGSHESSGAFSWWSIDDVIAFATMAIFFLAIYLILLALKLALGICLLSYARRRYASMKQREHESMDTHGRRVGGWGTVEVSEDKRRWIYDDDPAGLRDARERAERGRRKTERNEALKLDGVHRYTMAAKRIW